MGGGFKKALSKSPVQTIGMRLLQGDNIWRAVTQNAGTPAQRGLHQWINKQYKGLTSSGGDSSEAASRGQYDPMLMMYMSQMQNQQAQAAEAQRAQQEALAESQRQAGLTSAQQAQQEAQQQISMQDTLRQAQEAQTAQQQQEASQAAAQAQIGTGYDISRARQQQIANLAGGGLTSLPFYGYDSVNAGVGATGRPSNVFNLPKTTDIKFGGK